MGKSTPVQNQQKSLLHFFSKSPTPTRKKPVQDGSETLRTPPSARGSAQATTPHAEQVATPEKAPAPHAPSSPIKRRAIDSDDESDIELPASLKRAQAQEVPPAAEPKEPESAPVSASVSTPKRALKDAPSPPKVAPQSTPSTPTPKGTSGTPSTLLKFEAGSSYTPAPLEPPTKKIKLEAEEGRYHWVLNAKDADGNLEGSPDYDPRTIYIPSSATQKFTDFEKQYWGIKKNLWDTIVFFKKGKFYELYEKDALIAHAQFDLRLAGGGRANMQCAGIPEMSFDYWASAFINKGYKVAKCDQKETALAKEMRDTSAGKKEDKIIQRELSFILTAGTLTDEAMLVSDLSQFCMAIKQDGTTFGVAFVDTSTGAFSLSLLEDEEDLHGFETLVAQTRPREVILAKGNLSRYAEKILKNNSSVDTVWNIVKDGAEFWDEETTRSELARGLYFGEDADEQQFPAALQDAHDSPVLLSAVGGLLWYLRSLKLDAQLVSLGNFSVYEPVRRDGPMVIDGQTLQNLEVFANTFDQGTEGTLFKLLNKCVTPFGKRRLKSWVSHPLQNVERIKARQDAVQVLMDAELREHLEQRLAGMADVERLLSRVHAGRLPTKDFGRIISALGTLNKLKKTIPQHVGGLLAELCASTPDVDELVTQWENAFDHAKAAQGVLVPEPGVEPEFDGTWGTITAIEAALETELKKYRKEYSQNACFKDSGKELYLVELPAKIKVPDNWQQMAATKAVKRYWSPEVRKLVRELQEAKELHKVVCDKVQLKLYARFAKDYSKWMALVSAFSEIDCLLSLARVSVNMPTRCMPVFEATSRAHVHFEQLVHPCNPGYIPNTIELGGAEPKLSLLTGANAAGKSTVLRSAGCAVIMAQIGCFVPAEHATLSAVDSIMTRLGANDNIFAGKSTFHVELSETQRILSEASPRSLVVIDELGRGGSSSDGFAIAEATLHHLATHVGCLGYFATHYGTLYNSFAVHPEVKAERMAILAEEGAREVTFLYKLEAGQSNGSFGMNVASMCGVAHSIIEAAESAAQTYEHTQRLHKIEQGMPIGVQSDFVWMLKNMPEEAALRVIFKMAAGL